MRRDDVLLIDLQKAAQRVTRYTSGVSRKEFLQDEMRQSAVQHEILIMGEAANALSQSLKDSNPEVPWRRLIQLRNFYIHGYDQVDPNAVFRTATGLIRQVERLVDDIVPKEEFSDTNDDQGTM